MKSLGYPYATHDPYVDRLGHRPHFRGSRKKRSRSRARRLPNVVKNVANKASKQARNIKSELGGRVQKTSNWVATNVEEKAKRAALNVEAKAKWAALNVEEKAKRVAVNVEAKAKLVASEVRQTIQKVAEGVEEHKMKTAETAVPNELEPASGSNSPGGVGEPMGEEPRVTQEGHDSRVRTVPREASASSSPELGRLLYERSNPILQILQDVVVSSIFSLCFSLVFYGIIRSYMEQEFKRSFASFGWRVALNVTVAVATYFVLIDGKIYRH